MGDKNSSSTSRGADIDTDSIIDLIIKVMDGLQIQVMDDGQIKVMLIQAAKGGAIVSACTAIGGFVAGPLGLAVGAASGGLLAYSKTKGTFKSIVQIFNELSPERKQQIAYEIQSIPNKLGINDWAEFAKIAIIWKSLAASASQKALVEEFIRQSIPIIEKHTGI